MKRREVKLSYASVVFPREDVIRELDAARQKVADLARVRVDRDMMTKMGSQEQRRMAADLLADHDAQLEKARAALAELEARKAVLDAQLEAFQEHPNRAKTEVA